MVPVSPGVVQTLSTDFLPSFSSCLSPAILPCRLLLVRVPGYKVKGDAAEERDLVQPFMSTGAAVSSSPPPSAETFY
ncbi:hypothetical protein V6N11_066821 [Hibiscus sabdariffa]|uniref:Uncharacterized protein n=1 Tax=Hibiscus sabdariffa TaxID=183260 RepID=A0ABR2SP28_9ROSI